MRNLLAIVAALALTTCATAEDKRFAVGESAAGYVIIGVAEQSGAAQEASYTMLWRRVDPETGRFAPVNNRTAFEARTNAHDSVRVRGIPGEFAMGELAPGVYALDSVFAQIVDRRVAYVAQGVIIGPDRPTFEVRAGEAVYLGVWEMRLTELNAVTRLWRMDEADKDAVVREARQTRGAVILREPHTTQVPCTPVRLNAVSTRQVCG
ncbi:hypothetical protein [Terricaulis sp.]|uniref:hypothetical protein n=1 Tax=Terricaulis sp. TaxID=2768686 RepID=UPI003783FBFE